MGGFVIAGTEVGVATIIFILAASRALVSSVHKTSYYRVDIEDYVAWIPKILYFFAMQCQSPGLILCHSGVLADMPMSDDVAMSVWTLGVMLIVVTRSFI